ncbi:hypothetical protein [Brachybacterium epidermidis]|uniref:hypothetical protein n=1 Tax=Brachybacterium epidermidis TaxID=2781983 RepID=UPI00398F0A6C
MEILLVTGDDPTIDYIEHLTDARTRISPMLASIDLLYGERLLGPILTEEVGAIFDDWHWNRKIGGREFIFEPQARLKQLPTGLFMESFESFFERHRERSENRRTRVRIASQWYLQAKSLDDPLMRIVAFWLCCEALEIEGNDTNIAPIKTRIAKQMGDSRELAPALVVEVYKTRSQIAHGKTHSASPVAIEASQVIAEALLEYHLLGEVTTETKESLVRLARINKAQKQAPLA